MYKRKGTSMATNKTLYHRHFLLLWLLPILTASAACFAEVYKWVDDTGKIHFSDKKPEDAQAETLDIRVNSYSFPKIETNLLHSRSAPASSPTASRNIIMYSTARCGYCKKARAFFRKNNIAFKEYDVETTAKGRRDYQKLNGRGVPIILVGKQRLNGFSEERFMQIYRR